MMNYKLLNPLSGRDSVYNDDRIADFLFQHLDEFGDKKEDILKAIDYVFTPNRGGQIILGIVDKEIAGAVVINETGMSGYIPSNILVYIAVDKQHRGKGFGKLLMQHAIKVTKGGVALHVEPNNPAKFLYEKVGFTSKYLEMRYVH